MRKLKLNKRNAQQARTHQARHLAHFRHAHPKSEGVAAFGQLQQCRQLDQTMHQRAANNPDCQTVNTHRRSQEKHADDLADGIHGRR